MSEANEMYEGIVSKPESKVKMYVIATNEEIVIARETVNAIKQSIVIRLPIKGLNDTFVGSFYL